MTNDGSCMSPYRDFDVRSERKMKTTVGRTASFMSTNTSSRQPHYSGGQSLKYTRAISYNRSSNIYYTMNYSQEEDLDEALLSPNRNQYSCKLLNKKDEFLNGFRNLLMTMTHMI